MHPNEYVRARASMSELADRYQVPEHLGAILNRVDASDRKPIRVASTGSRRDSRAKFSGSRSI